MAKSFRNVPLSPLSVDILYCHWVHLASWHHVIGNPFWRLYWVSAKGFEVIYEGKTYPLSPKSLTLIPANTQCLTRSNNPGDMFFIHFTIEVPSDIFKPGVYSTPLTHPLQTHIKSLRLDACSGPREMLVNAIRIKQLCYDSLAQLPEEAFSFARYSLKITAAIELMAKNIHKSLSNHDLAQAVGMNTCAFIRSFHKEVGQTPQKLYLEMKMNKALLLLAYGERTIEEIAEQTGFCDRAHFSRVFKRFKSMGPAEYRRESKMMNEE